MRVAFATFADAATVREGLLHLLGGGVNIVGRSDFPAPAGVTLPLLLEASPDDLGEEHELTVDVRQPDGTLERFGRVRMGALTEVDVEHPDLPSQAIHIIPFEIYAIREPGVYEVAVLLDGVEQVKLPLKVRLLEES